MITTSKYCRSHSMQWQGFNYLRIAQSFAIASKEDALAGTYDMLPKRLLFIEKLN